MSVVGFSGARSVADAARVMDLVRAVVTRPDVTGVVTGACVGVDGIAGRFAHALRPDARHVVIVPADRSRVDPWWKALVHRDLLLSTTVPTVARFAPGLTVLYMPDGSSYRDRDRAVVTASRRLVALPAYPETDARSARSGTWLTVRLAREARVPVEVAVLNGLTPG